jgi:alcohol dehydrogenase (cytochrome c)
MRSRTHLRLFLAATLALAFLVLDRVLAAQLVTTSMLERAAADTSSWLSYGRDYFAQRFVRLEQITPRNVARLRPAWVFATGGDNRGLQATPLIHNGVIYLAADQSRVFAIDARTGQKEVGLRPEDRQRRGARLLLRVEQSRCRAVGRSGLRRHDGRPDDRARSRNRRRPLGNAGDRLAARLQHHGAPLVVKDMVLTGVAGGEFGIRGFVKAFDAKTGAARWTAYTIPGPGEPGHETWPGETWRHGGGPTWTTGVFDPALGLVYWNTGNAAPWNCRVRDGDNKWTASTIAIDAESGTIRWGYQYTPHDCWDYDAVSTPVLADVVLGDRGLVKALFHHDKNGFFYALDRTNGTFLYGEPIVPGITWTRGLDPQTGRPRVNEEMIATSGGPEVGPIVPSLEGSIDWQPLAFNPDLGLIYFMSNQWAMGFKFWALDKLVRPANGEWYLGADYQQYLTSDRPGNFVAFDVARRTVRWRAVSPAPFWAGAVATSAGLVFTGDMRGYFMALDARTGSILWQFQTGSGIIGSPISYQLDGRQYLAVPSGGIGGDMTFYYKEPKAGNLWVFALDGGGPTNVPTGTETNLSTRLGALPKVGEPGSTLGGRVMPGYGFPATDGTTPIQGEPPPQPTAASSNAMPPAATQEAIATGERLYRGRCVGCHQAGGASGPNIFRTALSEGEFGVIVAKGRTGTLMPAFESLLTAEEVRAIHAFVRSRDRLQ